MDAQCKERDSEEENITEETLDRKIWKPKCKEEQRAGGMGEGSEHNEIVLCKLLVRLSLTNLNLTVDNKLV